MNSPHPLELTPTQNPKPNDEQGLRGFFDERVRRIALSLDRHDRGLFEASEEDPISAYWRNGGLSFESAAGRIAMTTAADNYVLLRVLGRSLTHNKQPTGMLLSKAVPRTVYRLTADELTAAAWLLRLGPANPLDNAEEMLDRTKHALRGTTGSSPVRLRLHTEAEIMRLSCDYSKVQETINGLMDFANKHPHTDQKLSVMMLSVSLKLESIVAAGGDSESAKKEMFVWLTSLTNYIDRVEKYIDKKFGESNGEKQAAVGESGVMFEATYFLSMWLAILRRKDLSGSVVKVATMRQESSKAHHPIRTAPFLEPEEKTRHQNANFNSDLVLSELARSEALDWLLQLKVSSGGNFAPDSIVGIGEHTKYRQVSFVRLAASMYGSRRPKNNALVSIFDEVGGLKEAKGKNAGLTRFRLLQAWYASLKQELAELLTP